MATDRTDSTPPTPRRRRPSAEVRRLILDAAQGLFAAKGFRGTSTREIADRAGVAEVLLFRNFGSKADLYSTAVVLPLIDFFEDWLTSNTWDWDEAGTEARLREFYSRLYGIGRENRGLIVSYLAMSVFEPDVVAGLEHSSELDGLIDQLAEKSASVQVLLGVTPHKNVRIGTRATIGMVLAMALFDDLGVGDDVTSEDVIDELTQLVLHGALHRPPAPPPRRARTKAAAKPARGATKPPAPRPGPKAANGTKRAAKRPAKRA